MIEVKARNLTPATAPAIAAAAKPAERSGSLVPFLAVFAFMAIWPLIVKQSYIINIGTNVCFFAIGAASLHLIIRTGHVSLGHAAFLGIGAYTTVLLFTKTGWPYPLALAAGVAAAGGAALIIGPIILRLTGKYFVLVTFLLGELIRMVFVEWISLTGGAQGITQIPPPHPIFASQLAYYYLALVVSALVVAAIIRLLNSEIGRAMDAMRQSPNLTECAGVPVVRFKVMIFVIACALVGLQGGLQAPFLRTIEPLTYGPLESLNMVVMNVIGGMTSIVGPLLGTAFLVVLPELLRDYVLMQRIFFGICLIVVMAFLPGGIVELWSRLRRATAKREG